MKIMRMAVVAVLIVSLMLGIPFAAQAQQREFLTLDHVVRISDTEMILEFSQPIIINKNKPAGVNAEPYFELRWVSKTNNDQRYLQDAEGNNITSSRLAWPGTVQYVDDQHDRLLWTITPGTYGCDTISDVIRGGAVATTIREQDLTLRFIVQEYPFDRVTDLGDGNIGNITTEDGSQCLFPTEPHGWEACALEFDTNYGYNVDRSLAKDVYNVGQDWDFSILAQGKGSVVQQEPTGEPTVVKVAKLDAVNVLILGSGVLVTAALLIILIVSAKKKGGKTK